MRSHVARESMDMLPPMPYIAAAHWGTAHQIAGFGLRHLPRWDLYYKQALARLVWNLYAGEGVALVSQCAEW